MIAERLDLSFIAARLEGLEETIISKLIDRAQFCTNSTVYKTGESGFIGDASHSLFEIRLIEQEQMDARFGRFCAPEERPFTKDLPSPQRVVTIPDCGLRITNYELISQSNEILCSYLDLIPRICMDGDDGQYGSSVEHDIYVIQAIARRIHYGALYVAESKYTNETELYRSLIISKDQNAVLERLTRKSIEDRIVDRIREKTISTQSMANRLVRNVIDPDIIAEYYKNWIIPLTKKGEIAYLFNRQDI